MSNKSELDKLDKKTCIILVLGTFLFLAITRWSGVIFLIVAAAGGYWYYKSRGSSANFTGQSLLVQQPKPIPRTVKILAGIVVGSFTGSFMGIAAMGSAIAATIPLGVLGGYLAYIYTKKSE